jgi:phage I-like protein
MKEIEEKGLATCAGSLEPLALPVLPAGEVPEWVMVARVGRWEGHPVGLEHVTPAHLRSALDYFERHYRAHGAELPVDYHHASVLAASGLVDKAPAAGWIRQMDLRADDTQLWARVLWTAEAAQAIAARQFRCLSPVLRFGAPDRVTAQPVAMLVHSVALTNTPFLTELPALNESACAGASVKDDAGADAGAAPVANLVAGASRSGARPDAAPTDEEGGGAMPILAQMAAALGRPCDELQQELGLESAEDVRVAEGLVACAARSREVETRLAACEAVARALGLPDAADAQAVLNAVGSLVEDRRSREAAQLVDGAVAAGKVPPAQRGYLLGCALADMEGTRRYLDGLAPLLVPCSPATGLAKAGGRRSLTDAERSVCRQLGLSEEAFLAADEDGLL